MPTPARAGPPTITPSTPAPQSTPPQLLYERPLQLDLSRRQHPAVARSGLGCRLAEGLDPPNAVFGEVQHVREVVRRIQLGALSLADSAIDNHALGVRDAYADFKELTERVLNRLWAMESV